MVRKYKVKRVLFVDFFSQKRESVPETVAFEWNFERSVRKFKVFWAIWAGRGELVWHC
jgi:hypothetical protein